MSRLIDAWFELGRESPRTFWVRTHDGWRLSLYRYPTRPRAHRTPVLLCHGMSSNRWNMDGPGRQSLARFLAWRGYDAWVIELRGAGRSTRPTLWNRKGYDWTFEDYVQHDGPAALQKVLRQTGAEQVHWVGHSMGGMIAYALLMSPAQEKLASVVTLGSPTMSQVGHPLLDLGVPYRSLLRFLPDRVPIGVLSRLAAPLAPFIAGGIEQAGASFGFAPGNSDSRLLRTLMWTAIDDLPASLLREFARWYDTKAMSDRYAIFDFTEHLERIRTPLMIVAGEKDDLTPVRDLEYVYEQVASEDKEFHVLGTEHGCRRDYGHVDLVLGTHAPDDVYPLVADWLDRHRGVVRGKGRKRVARLRTVAAPQPHAD